MPPAPFRQGRRLCVSSCVGVTQNHRKPKMRAPRMPGLTETRGTEGAGLAPGHPALDTELISESGSGALPSPAPRGYRSLWGCSDGMQACADPAELPPRQSLLCRDQAWHMPWGDACVRGREPIPDQDPERKSLCFASTDLSTWVLAPLSGADGTEATGLGLPKPTRLSLFPSPWHGDSSFFMGQLRK